MFRVLWLAFFFQGMAPGFWYPSLTNILTELQLSRWVTVAFVVPPLCALVSPLVAGAAADQRISADRLYLWSTALSIVLLGMTFLSLDLGWHPAFFLLFLAGNALCTAPTWGLLTTIALSNLPHGERKFPLVRVGATFGWVAGGLVTSYVLRADSSVLAGYGAVASKVMACGIALLLPMTPPLGAKGSSWTQRLGLGAFSLFRERDHAVFFGVTTVFSIPLVALYMHSPEFLKILGDPRPSGTMTIAQATEVVSMFVIGAAMTRYRVKTVLSWALGISAIRYGFSAIAGVSGSMGWHVLGIALHGVCYTFYFVTAQVFLARRVEPQMRGQAQGLLSVVSGGAGPLAGALLCGWLRALVVKPDGTGWEMFWTILGGVIAVCFVVFAIYYRGIPVTTENSVEASAQDVAS